MTSQKRIRNKRIRLLEAQKSKCFLCENSISISSACLIIYQRRHIVSCRKCCGSADEFTGKKIQNRREIIKRLYKKRKHCYYCNRIMALRSGGKLDATLDHVVPRSLGGTNKLDNIVLCCVGCNSAKSSMTDLEYFWFLRERDEQ